MGRHRAPALPEPTLDEAITRLREAGPYMGPNAPHLAVVLQELERLLGLPDSYPSTAMEASA